MKFSLAAGLAHTLTDVVPERMTVPRLIPDSALIAVMQAALVTPYMIGLMEWAATEPLAMQLDAGEGLLGAHVDVSHTAATVAGRPVTVVAKVVTVEGRKVSFEVEAHDGLDVIGRGRHVRMVVPLARFEAAVNAKAARAGVPGLQVTSARAWVDLISSAGRRIERLRSTFFSLDLA